MGLGHKMAVWALVTGFVGGLKRRPTSYIIYYSLLGGWFQYSFTKLELQPSIGPFCENIFGENDLLLLIQITPNTMGRKLQTHHLI